MSKTQLTQIVAEAKRLSNVRQSQLDSAEVQQILQELNLPPELLVELESFSPQKLIQILHRGIAGSRDLGSDDSSLILLDGTDSSIYVFDSFG